MRTRALAWTAVIGWAAVIFAASSRPGSQIPGKYGAIAHVIEYAILAALLVVAMAGRLRSSSLVAVAVIVASAYGITDEFHQVFVPGRVADVADWGLDTLGAMIGAASAVCAGSLLTRRANRGLAKRDGDQTA